MMKMNAPLLIVVFAALAGMAFAVSQCELQYSQCMTQCCSSCGSTMGMDTHNLPQCWLWGTKQVDAHCMGACSNCTDTYYRCAGITPPPKPPATNATNSSTGSGTGSTSGSGGTVVDVGGSIGGTTNGGSGTGTGGTTTGSSGGTQTNTNTSAGSGSTSSSGTGSGTAQNNSIPQLYSPEDLQYKFPCMGTILLFGLIGLPIALGKIRK